LCDHLENTHYFIAEEEDSIVDLKECHHIFHKECVMIWLGLHDTCPFCRKDVVSTEEFRKAAIHVLGIGRVSPSADARKTDDIVNLESGP